MRLLSARARAVTTNSGLVQVPAIMGMDEIVQLARDRLSVPYRPQTLSPSRRQARVVRMPAAAMGSRSMAMSTFDMAIVSSERSDAIKQTERGPAS